MTRVVVHNGVEFAANVDASFSREQLDFISDFVLKTRGTKTMRPAAAKAHGTGLNKKRLRLAQLEIEDLNKEKKSRLLELETDMRRDRIVELQGSVKLERLRRLAMLEKEVAKSKLSLTMREKIDRMKELEKDCPSKGLLARM
jgi:hypothetical protein